MTAHPGSTIHLVLEIIPPVWPCLLNASLLLDDSVFDHTTKDAERHRNTMIVIAMHTGTLFQLGDGFSVDLKSIVQLLRFHTKLGYR